MKEDRRLRKNPRTGNKDHYTHKNIRHGQFRGRADTKLRVRGETGNASM